MHPATRRRSSGVLICHDSRYQELYREYKKYGVQLMFHSYHQAGRTPRKFSQRDDIWGITTPPAMQTYAANNHIWISATNSSQREACWPSFFVRPDGVICGKLTRNRVGVLISEINTETKSYDASADWRDRAMRGIYHSGTIVKDTRSTARRAL